MLPSVCVFAVSWTAVVPERFFSDISVDRPNTGYSIIILKEIVRNRKKNN